MVGIVAMKVKTVRLIVSKCFIVYTIALTAMSFLCSFKICVCPFSALTLLVGQQEGYPAGKTGLQRFLFRGPSLTCINSGKWAG